MDNKDYVYYWYHHGIPYEEVEKIQECIDNHDFNTFIKFYKKYSIKAIECGKFNEWIPMIFLPNDIAVFNKNNDEIIEYIDVLNKDNFNKITYSEYENG